MGRSVPSRLFVAFVEAGEWRVEVDEIELAIALQVQQLLAPALSAAMAGRARDRSRTGPNVGPDGPSPRLGL